MRNNIFNENMSSNEARAALFKAVEGKTGPEIEALERAFDKVFAVIWKRECVLSENGWLID